MEMMVLIQFHLMLVDNWDRNMVLSAMNHLFLSLPIRKKLERKALAPAVLGTVNAVLFCLKSGGDGYTFAMAASDVFTENLFF